MKYQTLFVIFEKQQNLKLSSAANCRWRFKSKTLMLGLTNRAFDLRFSVDLYLLPYFGRAATTLTCMCVGTGSSDSSLLA